MLSMIDFRDFFQHDRFPISIGAQTEKEIGNLI
jgi:hypothetical protein